MRIRTNTDWVTTLENQVVVLKPGGANYGGLKTVTYGTAHRVMLDSPTPGFRKAQRLGTFVFTDAEYAKTDAILRFNMDVDLTIETRAANGVWSVTGGHRILGPAHTFGTFDSTPLGGRLVNCTASVKAQTLAAFGQLDDGALARDVCEKNVWAKAGSPDANVIVSLGEIDQLPKMFGRNSAILGQIVKMIRQAPKQALRVIWEMKVPQLIELAKLSNKTRSKRALASAIDRAGPKFGALAKGAGLKVLRSIPKLANSWLELRYGYLATGYDIQSYLSVKKRRSLRRIVSAASNPPSTTKSSASTALWVNTGSATEANRITRTTTTSNRTWASSHNAGLYVRTHPSAAVSNALGFPNLASAAWELSTLSFVVDWFVDVGKTIASLEGYLLTDWVGGWSSSTHDVQETLSKQTVLDPALIDGRRVSGTVLDTCMHVQTVKYIVRKRIQPPSVFPSIKIKLNTTRMIDASALLVQQAGRLSSSLVAFKTR